MFIHNSKPLSFQTKWYVILIILCNILKFTKISLQRDQIYLLSSTYNKLLRISIELKRSGIISHL